jgi:aminomethyltransferase
VNKSQILPLNAFHQKHGARFADFAGWSMPTFYTTMMEEHKAVRESVGLFDVSHMGEFLVQGKDAKNLLNYLITNDLDRINDGQALYSPVCYPDGGTVDDWILYRIDEAIFFICVNASNREKDLSWIQEHIGSFDCQVEDVSDQYGLLAVQGPKAAALMSTLAGEATIAGLAKFAFCDIELDGESIRLSRTGYTGEDGFELYTPVAALSSLAETIWQCGQDFGMRLCGLGARDSLRLEAKLPLYGHELDRDISPVEAGFGWAVRLQKDQDFIGRAALAEQKQGALRRRLLHFHLEDRRIARQGASIFAAGREVGVVCSGSLSPMLNKPIGSALVEIEALKANEPLSVDIRDKRHTLLGVK